MDSHFLSISEITKQYGTGATTPSQQLSVHLAQVEALNESLNVFSYLDVDHAKQMAAASDARWQAGESLGPLDGIVAVIKDSVLHRGWPTRYGSLAIEPTDQEWLEDAPVVEYLRDAGVIILGKTTMPEFGWKGVTDHPEFGVTRNPINPEKTCGGSSGGAAVAVQTGMCSFAIGTDGGGSIRIPASFCGIVGLKPTLGLVPSYPPSNDLVVTGPLTRTVTEAGLVMNTLVRQDSRSVMQVGSQAMDYAASGTEDLKGMKVGVALNFGGFEADDAVVKSVSDAITSIKDAGIAVTPIEVDFTDHIEPFITHWLSYLQELRANLSEERFARLEPGLQYIINEGAKFPLEKYIMAQSLRRQIQLRMHALFDAVDVIITPTMPCTAFDIWQDSPQNWPEDKVDIWTPFTTLINFTGNPALSLPCGVDAEGLPIGLQIIGRHFEEARVLAVGKFIEELLTSC